MATIDKMEQQLRPPTIGLKPYEPKVIPLITGEDMLVREITRDDNHEEASNTVFKKP